jgi:MoaA/NifB/PqqE/SkfB family radical SAM enzyme
MRISRVATNETCNHRCGFCDARREHERASVAAGAAVRARIDDAVAATPHELVFTGGEPTLRRDLGELVRYAKARGVDRVALETNATRIDAVLAHDLAVAGLDRARVHMPAWGERLDALSRSPGAFVDVVTGITALADAGIVVEGAVPIVRENLDDVAAIPTGIRARSLPVARLWARAVLGSPDASQPASAGEIATAMHGLADAARAVGLPLGLDPAVPLPPCLFARPARVAHLFALNPGGALRPGHTRFAACDECRVRDRCPGVPSELAARGARPLAPIADARIGRRLTIISTVEQQVERELVTREIWRGSDGGTVPAHIVRIHFHCNQACEFCFVSTHLPPPQRSAVESAIAEIGALGGVLVLSGGEPTLAPDLPELVALGKRLGAREIELQTNAVRLAEPALVDALVAAGLDVAFVSLHGATAAISDRVTAAPGTFAQTVLGLDALVRSPMRVRINFVLCAHNLAEFPAFVEMVADRWSRAAITVSFVAPSTDLVPRTPELVPRYADVLPQLEAGLRIAAARGLEVGGFDSMCGIPLCLVPGDRREFFGLAELPGGYDRGEFVKTGPCDRCVLERRCFGVRRGYAELFGTDELRPIAAR